MVKQYPHTIRLTTSGEATYDPATGNWIPADGTTEIIPCRAEPNGGNGYVVGVDGTRIDYAWIVYLPLSNSTIEVGQLVQVFDNETELARDTVKRFSKGQLNMRIWL